MTGPYTRDKLHVLLSVDAARTDLSRWQYLRSDNDFGMVWIKSVGKGRVFNSVLGHRPEFYMMPDLVKLMLGGRRTRPPAGNYRPNGDLRKCS
jgi:type 1 glutamine amidotransferase